MINRIKETVQAYLNTDNRGNFSPSKFNTLLHHCIIKHFEMLFFEANRNVNRQNRGLINGGLENTTDKVRERIEHYLEPDATMNFASGVFSLPDDLRYFDEVEYSGESIELCKSRKEFNILKALNPSIDYPIGVKIGSTVQIFPDTIQSGVTVTYLRNPRYAKWTYLIIDDVEIYNPSANDFVDVDIHPSMEAELTISVLKAFGVNLKEQDIQAITQQEQAVSFNQEIQT